MGLPHPHRKPEWDPEAHPVSKHRPCQRWALLTGLSQQKPGTQPELHYHPTPAPPFSWLHLLSHCQQASGVICKDCSRISPGIPVPMEPSMPSCWPHSCLRIGCNHISGVQELTHADREGAARGGAGLAPHLSRTFLPAAQDESGSVSCLHHLLLLGLSVHGRISV